MAKRHTETIDGVEYTFQSVSPTWYYEVNDDCGMTGGKRKTAEYMDTMFKNVVVSPVEVRSMGLSYFDDKEDIKGPALLIRAIENFLQGGKQRSSSTAQSPKE